MMNLGGKQILKLLTLSTIFIVILMIETRMAKPVQDQPKRAKRSGISDQRLAELETLLELKKLRENFRTRTPVAYGLFDPAKIGKRRKRAHHFKDDDYDIVLTKDNNRGDSPIIFETYDYKQ